MDYTAARINMVENQIRTNRVIDPAVTAALAEIPREVFVPKALRACAYVDEDLDVGGGRVLPEPLVVARLLIGAGVTPSDVVLCIGDATGYVAAVLSKLAQTVVSVECDAEWAARAGQSLSDLGIDNAAVVRGPLEQGYAAQAPYDVILFAGAVNEIPAGICRQLADGGRLVSVLSTVPGRGKGTLVVRVGDTFGRRVLFDLAAPLLPGFESKPKFVF
ncbi:protein-L-isoaspartate O-methyltransferase family protein [Magnetospirillum aberrantis]|uniref:Protein-L-isoaspartate O-methyltransferase n=1 Tax=Magnetospirillum aberrantis SpK TaxID=908842 RepID=A0A7C9QTU2_9PROT|nr:protein-L-isoaspartate O-methyltransferase [Magnetospirillum aberrantis]NFV80404.1 protein-L-isoaspartate O-methyltransferase [Magnetospirillum aberrantis SpK]